jgi:hypothetical protein
VFLGGSKHEGKTQISWGSGEAGGRGQGRLELEVFSLALSGTGVWRLGNG